MHSVDSPAYSIYRQVQNPVSYPALYSSTGDHISYMQDITYQGVDAVYCAHTGITTLEVPRAQITSSIVLVLGFAVRGKTRNPGFLDASAGTK